MPAIITHALFADHILSALRNANLPANPSADTLAADVDALHIGSQGPDIFYFHRVFPWQRGRSFARVGLRLHDCHPAALLTAFKRYAIESPPFIENYIQGFICHYALDCAVHPFVYAQQKTLQRLDPRYAPRANPYHYRVESALDTLCLQRFTGLQIKDCRLQSAMPARDEKRDLAIGQLYAPLLADVLQLPDIDPALLAKAPGDMRHALFWMTDRYLRRTRLIFRPMEILSFQGHFLSSLIRPQSADDWDYANLEGREWAPGHRENFFELFAQAQQNGLRIIAAYAAAPADFDAMRAIVGNLGFDGNEVTP